MRKFSCNFKFNPNSISPQGSAEFACRDACVLPQIHWPSVNADRVVHVVVDLFEYVHVLDEARVRSHLHSGQELVHGVIGLKEKNRFSSFSFLEIALSIRF